MRARRFSALAFVASIALAACNAILGNEARTIYDGDATTDGASEVGAGDTSPSSDVSLDDSPKGDAASDEAASAADAPPEGPRSDGACGDVASDSLNCGSCGHSCLGAACVGGMCQPTVLVSGINAPQGMVLDSAALWWIADNYVYSCPTTTGCGGVPIRETAPLAGPAISLTQMGDSLYFTAASTLSDGGYVGDVEAWAKYSLTTPSSMVSGYLPRSIVPCGGWLCWTDTTGGSTDSTIYTCPTTGCTSPRVLTTDQSVNDIASDGQNVYIDTVSSIDGCSLAGCPAPTSINPQTLPLNVVYGGGQLVWSENQNSVIACTLPNCQGTTRTLAKNIGWPHGIVLDGTSVYFTTYVAGGALIKCDVTGGSMPVVMAKNLPTPDLVAVDATRIYWSTTGGGASNGAQILWVAR
jgi:hypothetical protein